MQAIPGIAEMHSDTSNRTETTVDTPDFFCRPEYKWQPIFHYACSYPSLRREAHGLWSGSYPLPEVPPDYF